MHQLPKRFISQVLLDGFSSSPDLPPMVTVGDTITHLHTKYKVRGIVEDCEKSCEYIVLATKIPVQPMWFHVDKLILDGYEIDLNYVETNDTDYVKIGDMIPGFEAYTIDIIVKPIPEEGFIVYATSKPSRSYKK